MSIIEDFAEWLQGHILEATSEGYSIDLLVLPEEAEAPMVTNLMSTPVRAETCHMIERKDNTVRLYLLDVPIKFSKKLPSNTAWFRCSGGKDKKVSHG